jgi:hypothetical protein
MLPSTLPFPKIVYMLYYFSFIFALYTTSLRTTIPGLWNKWIRIGVLDWETLQEEEKNMQGLESWSNNNK